jgi:hypothetical protein
MGVAAARDTMAKAERDETNEGILVKNDRNVRNNAKE